MNDWYAIRTVPRCEFRADAELEEVGIERFTPRYKRSSLIRYTKGRVKTIDQPLLSGYIFAALDFGPNSHHPRALKKDCKHVIDVLGICGKPVPVRSAELRQLRLLCDAGAFDQGRARGSDNRFKDGDPVRIGGGALVNTRGIFRETCGGMRPRAGFVRVVLDRLFGQVNFNVDVPRELVEAA